MAKPDVYNVDCPSQSILALIGSKWSMLLLCALRAGPARTHALKRRLSGVSAKMLTQTLRELERHGEIPPRVEYSLTPLGRSLASLVIEIENWVTANYSKMTGIARRYDSPAASSARYAAGRTGRARLHEAHHAPPGKFEASCFTFAKTGQSPNCDSVRTRRIFSVTIQPHDRNTSSCDAWTQTDLSQAA